MIESSERPRLALEARHAIGVPREALRQDFDRHIAPELGIGGPPHFAHPTLADLGGDPVMRDGLLRSHWRSTGTRRRSSSKKFSKKITWFCVFCPSVVSSGISPTMRLTSGARS